VAEIEFRGRWLGTTATADFVPATVDVIPKPNEQLMMALRQNQEPDRVNRATLPAGAAVVAESLRPLHTRYSVASPEPFSLRLYQFAFPGWRAEVDGVEVPTELGLPEGFMVIPLPAGTHVVDVRFGATPARRFAGLASALAALTTVGVAGALALRGSPHDAETRFLDEPGARRAALLVGAMTVVYGGVLAPLGWLHLASPNLQAIPAESDLFRVFGGQAALIGYTAPDGEVQPGETIEVTLYWQALQEMEDGYQSFLHLNGPDGRVVAQVDKLNPGDFPTRRWPLDRYVRDPYRLRVPASLPAGTYELTAGLWLAAEGRRLPVLDDAGTLLGDAALLGTVVVRP
jgi:hypothetical protein